jgi:hypothetical protein
MKRMLILPVLLIFGSALADSFPTLTVRFLGQYYGIQKSLAEDSTKGVSQSAAVIEQLSRETAAKESKPQLAAIFKAAAKLQAGDLENARKEFGELSDGLIAYLKSSGAKRNPPYQFYCPMLKKNWLQPDKQPRNPYYGSSMLGCGELVQ